MDSNNQLSYFFQSFLFWLSRLAVLSIIAGILVYPYLKQMLLGYVPIFLAMALILLIIFLSRRSSRDVIAYINHLPLKVFLALVTVTGFLLRIAVLSLIKFLPVHDELVDTAGEQGTHVFFEATAMYPPGHPYFNKAVRFLAGEHEIGLILAYSIIGVLCCVWVYLIGKKIFDERVGRIAALIMMAFPSWLIYGYTEYDILLAFGVLTVVGLFVQVEPAKHSTKRLAMIGLVIGLTCLVKPIYLIMPFLLAVLYFLHDVSVNRCIGRALLLTCVAGVVIAPWTIRNYIVMNRFVLISNNMGYNLYNANNPNATGLPHWQPLFENEVDEYTMNKNRLRLAWAFIRQNPERFLQLALWRIPYTWGSDSAFVSNEYNGKISMFVMNLIRGICQTYYISVILLWALGLYFVRRETLSSPARLFLGFFPVYVWFLHLIFEAHPQHHISVLPFIAVFAALSLDRMAQNGSDLYRTRTATGVSSDRVTQKLEAGVCKDGPS